MRATAVALLALGACAWSTQDVALQTTSSAAIAVDWAETRAAVGPRCHETNPFLGTCPGPARIDLYFIAALGLHAALAAVLPAPWRGLWQAAVLGAEVATDINNWQRGDGP